MGVLVVQSKIGTAGSVTLSATTAGNTVVVLFNQVGSTVAPSLAGFTVASVSTVYASSADSAWILYKFNTAGGDTTLAPTHSGTATGVNAIEITQLGTSPTIGTPVVHDNQSSTTNPSGTFSSTNAGSIILMGTGASTGMTSIAWDAALTPFTAGTTTAMLSAYSIPGALVSSYVYTPNTLRTGRNHGNIVVEFIPTTVIPTVTTSAATSITTTTAVGNGNVTDNGGATLSSKGFCWSTSANPTTSNSKVVDGSTATGSYSDSMTGLSPSTTYHYRAYAINSAGTAYGADTQFTTSAAASSGNFLAFM